MTQGLKKIIFDKMHGLGNDFIIFEITDPSLIPTTAQFKKLSNRHTGIGFDQALVISPTRNDEAIAFYRIFNADGSEVEQCGNGARCVAQWLRLKGRAKLSTPLKLECMSGYVTAVFGAYNQVSIDMGVPHVVADLTVADQSIDYTAVSIGNPHIVIFVPSVEQAPVSTLGATLESHTDFPNRVNVGFLEVVDSKHGRLRVFERGVGETLACGTGACAAMAAGFQAGHFGPEVILTLPGGALTLKWQGGTQHLWMSGPAELAYQGEVTI